jgi:hypothetical protein
VCKVFVVIVILIKHEYPLQIVEKSADIKFHQKPYDESRVVSCGRTDGRTDMIVDFRVFLNASENRSSESLMGFYSSGESDSD